jgi:hypothetical protein
MKHFTAGLALALAMVAMGCGGTPKPTTAAGPSCADAAASAERIILTGNTDGPRTPEDGALIRDVIAERCPADAWAQPAITCFTTAQTDDDATTCAGMLTEAQRKAVGDAIDARTADGMGPGEGESAPAAAPPPPPTGSAAPPPAKSAKPPTDPDGGDE